MPLLHYWWSRPDALQWVWVGLAVSLLALAVGALALPTVLQMIWGRARIKLDFISSQKPEETWVQIVQCYVSQPPTNKWLKRLGVRRVAVVVTTRLVIRREQDREDVCSFVPVLRNINRERTRQMEIAGSAVPAVFLVVALRLKDGAYASPTEDAGDLIPLKPDSYVAEIVITYGEDIMSATKRFVVGVDSLFWT